MRNRLARTQPRHLLIGAVLLLALSLGTLWWISGDDEDDSPDRPAPIARSDQRAPTSPGTPGDDASTTGEEGLGMPDDPGGVTAEDLSTGLTGEGFSSHNDGRRIVLSVQSSAPIGTVGYIVPTSTDDSHGVVENVGTSWSRTTRAYGNPDYALIFIQAGRTGEAITCVVTVDGVETDRRVASGPWAQAVCQG